MKSSSWLHAADYAVDLEFKHHWHFAKSDENRMRWASYWTATMFLLDMAWDLSQVHDALDRLPQRGWDHFRHNMNFMFEANRQSYKERIMKAFKLVFGENQWCVPLVGRHFTQEEVRAQQPDTEEYHDPDKLDPSMFPAEPKAAPPTATREGVSARVKPPPPGLTITTPTVKLQSAPSKSSPVPPEAVTAAAKAKAAAEETRRSAAASTSDQLPSQASLATGRRRAYYMDDHLPEYEYTLVVSADGHEVPAINFDGACYELELVKAQDVKSIQRA